MDRRPRCPDRARTSLHAWVDVALRKPVRRTATPYWRAKEILETAALEGQRFTVEALAAVLGEDVEDLIDWIDDHLAGPDGPSLLEEDGFVERAEGVDPPELRCYRFRSAMVAGVLRQEVLAGTNGKELARRYAHALAQAYRWSSVEHVGLDDQPAGDGGGRRGAGGVRSGGGRTAGGRGGGGTVGAVPRRAPRLVGDGRRSWRRRWSG